MYKRQEEKLNQEEIHINLGDPFTLSASNLGNYELKLKLFGLFDVGNMQIDVVEEEELIPCGAPIGIYIRTCLLYTSLFKSGKSDRAKEAAYNGFRRKT